jgi:hypothetical protein
LILLLRGDFPVLIAQGVDRRIDQELRS